jgi:hypothetical protein
VPVAAAGQAEVGAADPHPAVGGGVGKHRLDQLRVAALELLALDQRPARLGDPGGERVAKLLQLTEVEHPRRPGGRDPVRDDDPTEALGDEAGELPLEPADLAAQLGPGAQLLGAVDLERRHLPRLPVEQIRHAQSLSRLEGGGGNP